MSYAKRRIEEELEKTEKENEGRCCDCGSKLTKNELDCGRDMCFECYCFHQG